MLGQIDVNDLNTRYLIITALYAIIVLLFVIAVSLSSRKK